MPDACATGSLIVHNTLACLHVIVDPSLCVCRVAMSGDHAATARCGEHSGEEFADR